MENRGDDLRAGGYAVTAMIARGILGRCDPQRVEHVVGNLLSECHL